MNRRIQASRDALALGLLIHSVRNPRRCRVRVLTHLGSPGPRFLTFMFLIVIGVGQAVMAAEPSATVREGLRLYAKEQFDEAREKFATASEELDKQKSAASAIAAFDEACAAHRKGDRDRAKECYLRAGLSHDQSIAVSAHFNLGTLAGEEARKLAGKKPELVPVDKRQEILDQLTQAIGAFRHCLEIQSDHAGSRRNLELVRQWIKYYTDRWHEQDRQKRRDESNLIQFLEYLIQTQIALRETVIHLRPQSSANDFAELKRAQEELREEIPTLRDKIGSELRPPADPKSPMTNANTKELDEGITLLQSWADTASERMSAASRKLTAKEPAQTVGEQQVAIDELDRIWDAVIPFQPLLGRLLSDQTSITKALGAPAADAEPPREETSEPGKPAVLPDEDATSIDPANSATAGNANPSATPQELTEGDLTKLQEIQQKTLKKTRLLVPKVEAELERLESTPASPVSPNHPKEEESDDNPKQAAVDPEQAKAGFQKAIELAPQAVDEMEAAVKAMQQKDKPGAGQRAEAARRILEEIQQAQPKNPQDQQKNEDQKEQDKKNDDKQKQDKKQNEDQKKSDQSKQDNKKEEQKKDQDKQSKEDSEKKSQPKPQEQMSQDRMEDVLRKVRERQQEKRERDKRLKGQFMGKAPVDKDW